METLQDDGATGGGFLQVETIDPSTLGDCTKDAAGVGATKTPQVVLCDGIEWFELDRSELGGSRSPGPSCERLQASTDDDVTDGLCWVGRWVVLCECTVPPTVTATLFRTVATGRLPMRWPRHFSSLCDTMKSTTFTR